MALSIRQKADICVAQNIAVADASFTSYCETGEYLEDALNISYETHQYHHTCQYSAQHPANQ